MMSCSAITANIRPAAEYWFALFALLETIGLYGNNGARQAYDSYDEREYVWDEFDVIVDKGSPLFVDFGELLKLSYRNYPFMQYFKNPKMDHYLADKGESVQALYVGDSFDPSGFGERPSVNKLLLVAAPTIINMFLHF
ncbi:unnamed protein product [Toxocara canis]|uniref:Metallophos domain-containing protein n=1 Tax=Toxocara canis TaxID=6265 RepID=A0A183UDI6_TOXCA|nr:unnamed protein product [Toxocara canis]